MSGCNGCYNGCSEIVSDQCVKYTGDAIPSLDIDTGDNLATVIEKVKTYLLTVMDGTGIVPTLPPSICTLIQDELPSVGDITITDVVNALITAVCSLETLISNVESSVDAIEANYNIGTCLSGVSASSGTHSILQATINTLCALSATVTGLQAALSAYVRIVDINDYIESYLETLDSTKMYTKMVPYTAVEYYGTLTGKFDVTGAGFGDWEKIYLCNGLNGTPDKRGRIPVGATDNVGGGAMNIEVDPTISGNPHYDKLTTYGSNKVTLLTDNLPPHTHAPTTTVVDPGHRHLFGGDEGFWNIGNYERKVPAIAFNIDTSSSPASVYNLYTKSVNGLNDQSDQKTNVTVSVSNALTGGGIAHNNIPPVMGCYYIMYIP